MLAGSHALNVNTEVVQALRVTLIVREHTSEDSEQRKAEGSGQLTETRH